MGKQMMLWAAGAGLGLAVSFSSAAYAAAGGWTEEGGITRYVDVNGSYVKDEWRKKNGVSCYLDQEGKIAEHVWVDDTYYAGDGGVMEQESWIYEDGQGQKEKGWYYVGRTGQMEKDDWKTIEGTRYCFDASGRMRTGWYKEDGDLYYLGNEDQGYSIPGWRLLTPEKGGEEAWFYFQNNGKAKKGAADRLEAETIGDNKYYFDRDGKMLTGWFAVKEKAEPGDKKGISRYVYLGDQDQGLLKDQWLLTDEDPLTGEKAEEESWYYLNSRGTPAYLSAEAHSMGKAAIRIDGAYYFFDEEGRRQTGVVELRRNGVSEFGYFGGENGAMVTGRVTDLKDASGNEFDCYFESAGSEKGAGATGVKDGFLYADGVLAAAEAGCGSQPVKAGGRIYLVNENGQVQTEEKHYKVPDGNGYVIQDGVVYEANVKGEKGKEVKAGKAVRKMAADYVSRG